MTDDQDLREDEEENEELLLALEESLCCKRMSPEAEMCQAEMKPYQMPDSMEVRLCVASFLLWSELVTHSLLCKSWRVLELEDTLWQVYFSTTWPRLARRREAESGGFSQPWRVLFRAQWTRGNHTEDAVEEDWLDFNAAQRLRMPSMDASTSCNLELKEAIRQCREDLLHKGLRVPLETDPEHICSSTCRLHRLNLDDCDAFLCETSGALHQCIQNVPCASCVASPDGCFLVCPVSGRCFPKNNTVNEEVQNDAPPNNDWDPELSAAQQVGRWFEQGYFMSEDQAAAKFGGRRPRWPRPGRSAEAFPFSPKRLRQC